jgi:hypothetical protein
MRFILDTARQPPAGPLALDPLGPMGMDPIADDYAPSGPLALDPLSPVDSGTRPIARPCDGKVTT